MIWGENGAKERWSIIGEVEWRIIQKRKEGREINKNKNV